MDFPSTVVVFDIGGVLARICHTWQDAARAAGVTIHLDPDGATGLSECPLFDGYQAGTIDERRYLLGLGRFLGCSYADAERVHNGIIQREYDGIGDLVNELRSLGVRTGCLSNTNPPHWEHLLDGSFPAISALDDHMASHVVKLEKPNPQIFLTYARAFGIVGARIFYFDDNAANVASAATVGWMATRIDPDRETAPQIRQVLEAGGVLPNPNMA